MKILIDNGHGSDTSGKCSPDRRLLEYKYAREIAIELERELTRRGVYCARIVPEQTDIKLSERCRRANAWCRKLGASNVALVSVHVNAAKSDGQWHNARGCSVYVSSKNASAKSRMLAQIYTETAMERGLTGNRSIPAEKYWSGNFAIVRDTLCPAVLTENGFQDNKEDVEWLLSAEGRKAVVLLHADMVCKYITSMEGTV